MSVALSASSLWRVALCPASATLPRKERAYPDAKRGHAKHAKLRASLPPEAIGEIAFAYDVLAERAREVGRDIGRDYGPLADSEIPGTADVLLVESDHVRVTDWKTGNPQVSAHTPSPESNLQLALLAVSAAQVFGKEKAIVELVFTRTGEAPDAEWDAFDLAFWRARLREIWQSTRGNPEPVMGDAQCWRCPVDAAGACPAKNRRAA